MSFRDAVELGVAAFMAMPEGSDDEVVSRLLSVGVEEWLAERLVVWLPVAFARRLYSDVAFPDEYIEAGVIQRASSDPVFVAATARAATAHRDEMRVIALRSAEAKVVESAATAGRSLHTAQSSLDFVVPLPPLGHGDGGVPEPRAAFAGFLGAHGHALTPLLDGTYVRGELQIDAFVSPSFRPTWVMTQVDFRISHPRLANGWLFECFAGRGKTYREAVADAVHKFERGTVHVLIASLLDSQSCADQVTWEDWDHPQGMRRACLGAQLLLYGGGAAPASDLLDQLRDQLTREPLGDGVHAVRCVTMRDGDTVFADEVLLDGEPWEAGRALCAAYPWPVRSPAWGTRLFLMLSP